MKKVYVLQKRISLLVVFTILMTLSSISIYSQGLQIDMSFGFYNSTPYFKRNSYFSFGENLTNISNKTYSKGINSYSYSVGITKEIRSKVYLRTEIGLISTDLSINLSYDFDEGHGKKHFDLVTPLKNKKIYFGIMPEYRINYKIIDVFVNGGILFSSDIKNDFKTNYFILGANLEPIFGLALNGGINVNAGNLAFKFGLEYKCFNKSKLINFYHPYISYSDIGLKLGIIYSIGK